MLDIAVLGPLVVQRDGRSLTIPGATQRALLALLVAHRWTAIGPDRLIDDLWGTGGPRNPRNALQQAVAKLRAALGRAAGDGATVLTDDWGYRLDRARVRIDADRFATSVEQAQAALAAGNPAAAQRRFHDALALWRGKPFADLRDTIEVGAEVARLHELRLAAVEGRIEADLSLLRPEAVIVELGPLLDDHPLRERLWRHLLVALYGAGRQAEALEAYRRARATLVEQVGVEPGAELQRVHGLILAHDPSLRSPWQPSAIAPAEPVYELLDAVRDAVGALAAADRGADHAALVLAYVTALNRRPAAFATDRWLAAFDAAQAHVGAAIGWAVVHERADLALRLAVEAARYWDHRQLLDAARTALAEVIGADTSASSARSEALTWLAFFAAEQGDTDAAMAHLDDAIADAVTAGDPAREAGADAVASVVLREHDPRAAEQRASTALDRFLAHGTRREIAYGWTTHALAALAAGHTTDATASARAAAAIYAELGDRRGLAWTKATQAMIAAARGLDDEAAALRDEARAVALDLEDIRAIRHLDGAGSSGHPARSRPSS